MLNKLGHSVSYDDIQRIDTTWVAEILEPNDEYSTVPTIIRENTFIRCTFNSTKQVSFHEKPHDLPQNLLGNQPSSNPKRKIKIKR